jgi:hypothetical protein
LVEVTREDVLASISTPEHDEDFGKAKAQADAKLALVEVQGRIQYFSLQNRWSWFIVGWITFLIGFNVLLTAMVGMGCWDFANYQWFVTAVTVETFLQVVGMGYVAVRFLFSHGPK